MDTMSALRSAAVGLAMAGALIVPPAYGAEARAAIAQAQRMVDAARSQKALWTSAEEALLKARKALERGDEATAVEQARRAADQASLGIAQRRYPLTR